jgi:hypothetical protein
MESSIEGRGNKIRKERRDKETERTNSRKTGNNYNGKNKERMNE